jgi:hypothetical protein
LDDLIRVPLKVTHLSEFIEESSGTFTPITTTYAPVLMLLTLLYCLYQYAEEENKHNAHGSPHQEQEQQQQQQSSFDSGGDSGGGGDSLSREIDVNHSFKICKEFYKRLIAYYGFNDHVMISGCLSEIAQAHRTSRTSFENDSVNDDTFMKYNTEAYSFVARKEVIQLREGWL